MLLKGKNIVITGSGRGIGKEVALACAREGANMGLTSRTREELDNTKKEIEDLGTGVKVVIVTGDISKYEDTENIFKNLHNELGPLDGVIANAGYSRRGSSDTFEIMKFRQILDVNILGVYFTFRAALPHLRKDDKKNKARFIVTGSGAYQTIMPLFAAYTASKWGVVGLVKALAAEYKKENITFNIILPTMVDTRLLRGRKAGDGKKDDFIMNPWDLNEYYLFLLSDEANRINDEMIYTQDFQQVKKIINEAPTDKKENWEIFQEYLEERNVKLFNSVKKLKKFIGFLLERII
ncbi:MAG: SDR family oxidoreductase [Candidatus Lokiarchaeota archaeon]|nr:SDR family oxidoreductase [Candidatus Lokiarchaeota archaeon]